MWRGFSGLSAHYTHPHLTQSPHRSQNATPILYNTANTQCTKKTRKKRKKATGTKRKKYKYKRMVQLTLHGKPSKISDEEIYGDSSKYKHPDSTRLESNNVGGLNVNHRDCLHIGPANKTTRILNRLKAKKWTLRS